MTEGNGAQGEASPGQRKKRKGQGWRTVLPIVIIAVVIVFAALLITVLLVDDFKSIGDLFSFIGSQL